MKRRALRSMTAALTAAALLGACGSREEAPAIKFATYGQEYAAKPDFAQVEHEFPLLPADLARITPSNLALLDQEQVDQVYARLTAGPIPDGAFDGTLFFPRGGSGKLRLSEIAGGGLRGFAVNLTGAKIDFVGETLWKGKVFFKSEMLLRNRIEDLSALKKLGLVEEDAANPLKKIAVGGQEQWLLFPAKLYCGQSLLDGRRESIIIDYAFTDEIAGYRPMPDSLAGRDGFRIRDEIRMVRPGLYLGRAYIDRVFALNFVLYNKEVADRDGPAFTKTGAVNEDCWTGTQKRAVIATQ
jgi:hypothetical protein